jgi:excisionase family DNA binding protein
VRTYLSRWAGHTSESRATATCSAHRLQSWGPSSHAPGFRPFVVNRNVSFGVSRPQSLPGGEVNRVEDKNRMKVTIWEAAEYLGLTPTTVQDMVERGVLKADKFAGAIHIPREEVERIERETAP